MLYNLMEAKLVHMMKMQLLLEIHKYIRYDTYNK